VTGADSEALLRRFFERVLNGRDRAAAEELLAHGFTDHDPMPAQAPGIEGLLGAIDSMHEALVDCRYEPLLVIPEESKVAAMWRLTGTNTGSFSGQEATGKAVAVTGVDVLAVGEGQVQARWSKWERHIMFAQLGIGPPLGPAGG
jgi:predicted ester cyclase